MKGGREATRVEGAILSRDCKPILQDIDDRDFAVISLYYPAGPIQDSMTYTYQIERGKAWPFIHDGGRGEERSFEKLVTHQLTTGVSWTCECIVLA